MIGKVLFLMEKYCDADPKCGPTISEHLIVNAIKSTGLVQETKRFYFEVLSQQLGRERMSELLLEDCRVFQPDLVIFTPLGGALGDRLNPTPEAMSKIMDEAKIYLFLYDASPGCGLEVKWLPFCHYLGTNSIETYLYYKSPKMIFANAPISPRDFYQRNIVRDIDISHLGSIHSNRGEYLGFLRDNGINIYLDGGQREHRLSVEEFSYILSRSKISVNFCRDTSGISVIKHRVFEIASCGTLVFEEWGTDTPKLLDSGLDLVIFHDKQELLSLARYYLEHDKERAAIALSGHEKATKLYNATNVWGYIFEKIGFSVPRSLAEDKAYQLYKEKVKSL